MKMQCHQPSINVVFSVQFGKKGKNGCKAVLTLFLHPKMSVLNALVNHLSLSDMPHWKGC